MVGYCPNKAHRLASCSAKNMLRMNYYRCFEKCIYKMMHIVKEHFSVLIVRARSRAKRAIELEYCTTGQVDIHVEEKCNKTVHSLSICKIRARGIHHFKADGHILGGH